MEKNTETKNFILNTATKLFAAKGFDGVGVQEICTESQITKPTLYYYFGSKLGLLQEIINSYGGEFYKQLLSSGTYNGDFIKNLSDIVYATLDFAKKFPEYFKFHNALMFYPTDNEAFKIHFELQKKINKIFVKNLHSKFFALFLT